MMDEYGFLPRDWDSMNQAIRRFPEISKVILFGSRSMGNFKRGSDVDLAIVGKGVTKTTILSLGDLLNEVYPLPYMFDLHFYDAITNESLKDHIQKYGQEIYRREDDSTEEPCTL